MSKQTLAEQGKEYLEQLQEEGKPFFEEMVKRQEEAKNFFKKLFENKDENDINDQNNLSAC